MVGKVELKKLYTTKTIFLEGLDGWMDGWMDGSKSRFKDCLQQSTNKTKTMSIKVIGFDIVVWFGFQLNLYLKCFGWNKEN